MPFPPSWNTSRLPLLTQTSEWMKPGLGETKSPQFICKIPAALRDVPHLLPMPWFHFLIGTLSDKEQKWRQNRKERVDEILIENSPMDNAFFLHHSNVSANAWAVHFSRSRGVTMDRRNEWCYLTPDVISLIRLILWPCVPPLIRNQRDFHSSAHGFLLVYYLKTSFRCSRKSEGKNMRLFRPYGI